MPTIKIEELRATSEKACRALGYSAEEAKVSEPLLLLAWG